LSPSRPASGTTTICRSRSSSIASRSVRSRKREWRSLRRRKRQTRRAFPQSPRFGCFRLSDAASAAGGGGAGLAGGFLLLKGQSQLRLLAGREVGVDDASGGGLVELLGGEVVFLLGLFEGAGEGFLEAAEVGLDGAFGGAVADAVFLALSQVLLGALRVRHLGRLRVRNLIHE